jgi:hypothetical protein
MQNIGVPKIQKIPNSHLNITGVGCCNEKKQSETQWREKKMRCLGITSSGRRCKRKVLADQDYCFQHNEHASLLDVRPNYFRAPTRTTARPRAAASTSATAAPTSRESSTQITLQPYVVDQETNKHIKPTEIKNPKDKKLVEDRLRIDFTNVKGIVKYDLEGKSLKHNSVTNYDYDSKKGLIHLTLAKPITERERAYLACQVVDPDNIGPDSWEEGDIYIIHEDDNSKGFPTGAELYVYMLDSSGVQYECRDWENESWDDIWDRERK